MERVWLIPVLVSILIIGSLASAYAIVFDPPITFLNPTPDVLDRFGFSVYLSGNNVLIGAPFDNTGAPDTGSVYLFLELETPAEQTQNVIEDLETIDQPKADDAIAKLDTAKDELAKDPPDNQAAVGNIEGAIGEIEAAISDGLDPEVEAELTELMDTLAGIARQLAVDAIDDAAGGDEDKISES